MLTLVLLSLQVSDDISTLRSAAGKPKHHVQWCQQKFRRR